MFYSRVWNVIIYCGAISHAQSFVHCKRKAADLQLCFLYRRNSDMVKTMVWCSSILLLLVVFVFSEAPIGSSDGFTPTSTISTTDQGNVTISPYINTSELQSRPAGFNRSRPSTEMRDHHSYGCRVYVFERTFTHPDCIPRRNVRIQGCKGHCTSLSYQWFTRNGKPTMHNSCNCCKSSKTRKGFVQLSCPRDKISKKRVVKIEGAKACRCRKCFRD